VLAYYKGGEKGEEIAHKKVKLMVLTLNKQFPFLNKKFLLRNSKGTSLYVVSERECVLNHQFPFLNKKFWLRNSVWRERALVM
jgi:hypothetical protein